MHRKILDHIIIMSVCGLKASFYFSIIVCSASESCLMSSCARRRRRIIHAGPAGLV